MVIVDGLYVKAWVFLGHHSDLQRKPLGEYRYHALTNWKQIKLGVDNILGTNDKSLTKFELEELQHVKPRQLDRPYNDQH